MKAVGLQLPVQSKSLHQLNPTAGAKSKFTVVTKHPPQKQGDLTWSAWLQRTSYEMFLALPRFATNFLHSQTNMTSDILHFEKIQMFIKSQQQ